MGVITKLYVKGVGTQILSILGGGGQILPILGGQILPILAGISPAKKTKKLHPSSNIFWTVPNTKNKLHLFQIMARIWKKYNLIVLRQVYTQSTTFIYKDYNNNDLNLYLKQPLEIECNYM